MRFKEEFLNEGRKPYIEINGIPFVTILQTSGRSYIKWQFMPKASKDLEKFNEEKYTFIEEIPKKILQQTGIKATYEEDDPGAGLIFYIDRLDLEMALIKKLSYVYKTY